MINETVEEIEDMQTSSSSVVAVKAAEALTDLLGREFATVEEFERDLDRNVSALRRANPSHASLQNAMLEIRDTVTAREYDDLDAAKDGTREAIESVVDAVEQAKHRAADNAAALFEDGDTVLTHDYSTTVLEAIEQAASDGAYLDVYVTEARPRYLGRKTARTLASIDRVDATLLTDSASGHYLPECDRVVTGMTCIVDRTLYNRVGTFPIAAAAEQVGTPVTVVGSSTKIVEEGFVFENEYRPASEVMREPADGFEIENPTYDATPIDLIESVVTDEGEREF
ncbi:translation initiation factor eIF-2B subunit delta [Natronoarchaeum philippinense]|uniref:Translation initiation factor eIF-2B subunit delta n=1 Tax=Natronoarchaeum philippinense TaxID=558529 RepID=A0A285N723_NATPI|nr:translation initiation factor eIF-2B [Natronoarchaeum philippinense]SNZ05128.1 translation initiation factor eIF-2B subunit delta [Natronoarchaeum philippinense]